jgi:N-methylhydantoinase B
VSIQEPGTARAERLELDPVTFEVLRHKLDEVVAEAYHTIGRVSGSPIVYEAGDHQEAICLPGGEMVAFGAGVLHWVRSLSAGVRHVAREYAENPGINEDDQFLLNDPYVATVHANDVQVLAPLFWEGELIAWAGSASHQTDIGGAEPGSFCVGATEVFREGFYTPGLKIVEGGMLRKDVEATFANMVRAPDLGLLDIRAKIASNNVIKARLKELLARYGAETIKALFAQLISYSEERLRARLREMPDGSWRSANYVEGIADPYLEVRVELTKRGDSLTFDFTGTSPQTNAAENMGPHGTMSSAMNPLIAMLGHDLPWNEGLFKVVDFVLPEASIVNPRRPAAVSANVPSGANILVLTAAQHVLAQMCLASDTHRDEACGNIGASFNYPVFAGAGRNGDFFATLVMDGLAGGVGGGPTRDGENTDHNQWCVKNMIANVETAEMLFPLLYLWRREVADSGGPGRFRGGVGMAEAIMPWEIGGMVHVNVGCGTGPRNTLGLAGGLPAAHTPVGVVRGANLSETLFAQGRLPRTVQEMGGAPELLAPKGVTQIAAGDVFYAVMGSGGGGYGDPCERDPEAVRADVELGAVSHEMAATVYGVVLDAQLAVDEHATAQRRRQIAAERLEKGARHAEGA